jgi:hypothetical protein
MGTEASASARSRKAAAGVAEAIGEEGLDGRVAVLEAGIEHEAAILEGRGERDEACVDRVDLGRGEDADAGEAMGVGPGGEDVGEEELAVEHHVVAGAEALDARVDGSAGLVPEERGCDYVGHGSMPVSSGKPKARLRFCTAWLAAPLSRLSRVTTTTPWRLTTLVAKPPIVA